ncbi:MAG: hypothetical protein FWH15_01615 [Betaproteobacteria bacterium]|nr:hypothetical protein [Betaproteobacteria bacterium]
MENRPIALVACIGFFVVAVFAEEASLEERNQTRIWLSMQEESRRMRQEAEATLAAEREACDKKFFVNDCRNAAYNRYLEKLEQSRKIGAESRRLEIEQKRSDLETSQAQQVIDAEDRARKDAERAESVAKERAAREARYEERQARRAAEADKRAQKAAARRERAEKKQDAAAKDESE